MMQSQTIRRTLFWHRARRLGRTILFLTMVGHIGPVARADVRGWTGKFPFHFPPSWNDAGNWESEEELPVPGPADDAVFTFSVNGTSIQVLNATGINSVAFSPFGESNWSFSGQQLTVV